MILSDRTLREELKEKRLIIYPPPRDIQIQPSSIDLQLGANLCWPGKDQFIMSEKGFALYPGKFILGHTLENVTIPTHLVGQLNGKSSWGRRGLMVHSTAGYIDPGFSGQITLELKNIGNDAIHLIEFMMVAQIILVQLTTEVDRPYGHNDLNSHYQRQFGAMSARSK